MNTIQRLEEIDKLMKELLIEIEDLKKTIDQFDDAYQSTKEATQEAVYAKIPEPTWPA